MSKKTAIARNRDQLAERLVYVEGMIARGWRVGRIKQLIYARWGIKYSRAMDYIRQARHNILAEFERSPAEHTSESLAFYQQIQCEKDVPPIVRLYARKRIDELMGLDAPKRIHLGGDAGDGAAPLIMKIITAYPPGEEPMESLEGAAEAEYIEQGKQIEAPSTSGDNGTGASEAEGISVSD